MIRLVDCPGCKGKGRIPTKWTEKGIGHPKGYPCKVCKAGGRITENAAADYLMAQG